MLTRKQLDQNFKTFLQSIETIKQKYSNLNDDNLINQELSLIAVSKQHPLEAIIELSKLGQIDFAESYLQEAISKINEANKLNVLSIKWHYIGRIQSNKTKLIAENFAWVHSVSNLNIAKRLNSQRPRNLNKLNILLQININQDPDKSGIILDQKGYTTSQLNNLITNILTLDNISLRGFMCILDKASSTDNNFENQFNSFKMLTKLLNIVNKTHKIQLDTLSMGMSNDYEAAIAAGSNMLRIGSALFGPKN